MSRGKINLMTTYPREPDNQDPSSINNHRCNNTKYSTDKITKKTFAVIRLFNLLLHNNSDMMKDSNNIIRIINTHPCGRKAKMPNETFSNKFILIEKGLTLC